jgi:hypothetical protein
MRGRAVTTLRGSLPGGAALALLLLAACSAPPPAVTETRRNHPDCKRADVMCDEVRGPGASPGVRELCMRALRDCSAAQDFAVAAGKEDAY